MSISLKKNIVYSMIYQVLIMILPFILTPYISRVLEPEQLGEFNHATSLAYYFFIFSMLGVNSYGTREISKVQNDNEKLKSTFWQIYYIQFFLALISICIYILLLGILNLFSFLYLIQILYLASILFDINWFIFGIERFRFVTIRNSLVKILSIALIFIFVKSPQDINIYATIMTGSIVVALFFIWPIVFKKIGFQLPNFKKIFKHIKPNFALMIPIITSSVFVYFDNFLLGFMGYKKEVAFYSYANSLPNMLLSIMNGVIFVLMSRMSWLVDESKEKSEQLFQSTAKYTMILNLALMFGSLGVAKNFIDIYLGEKYSSIIYLFYIMVCTVPINGFMSLIKSAYMLPNKMDKESVNSSIIGAVIKVVLDFIMIPTIGVIGVCISSLISYFIIAFIEWLYTRKLTNYSKTFKCLPYFILLGGAMLVFLLLIDTLAINIFIKLVIQVFGGAIIYCIGTVVFFLFTSDPILLKIIKKKDKKQI